MVSKHFPVRQDYDDDNHDHDVVDEPSVGSASFVFAKHCGSVTLRVSDGKVRVSCKLSCGNIPAVAGFWVRA